jgi:hypothetical protein
MAARTRTRGGKPKARCMTPSRRRRHPPRLPRPRCMHHCQYRVVLQIQLTHNHNTSRRPPGHPHHPLSPSSIHPTTRPLSPWLLHLSAIPVSSTPAGGMSPYLKLKDHFVLWSQTVDPILKFDIDRETTQILPNPLKLVVIQRINHEDPHGSPQNPRLGAVYLNLAEYINQGNVERRYLLKESKTNATLSRYFNLST